jgi:NO-binding membrane sensor protein with MHYT domain
MSSKYMVGTFLDSDSLIRAVHAIRAHHFRIYDVYTPYPVHDLDHAMGLRRTRLPWVTAVAGTLALSFAIAFQFYTAVLDWPLNVGGKPDNSALAFVPICFELTVLIGGLVTFAALLFRARLYPGKRERLCTPGVTNDRFALVLRADRIHFDAARALNVLEACGAGDVQEMEGDL